jgi:fatty-acyl-CoA synthase
MLSEYISIARRQAPHRIAVEDIRGRARTYRDLDLRSTRLANALLGKGMGQGDRVAAWMETSVEYVELYVAAAKAGLSIVPVNTLHTASETETQLLDATPRALFFSESVAPLMSDVGGLDDLPLLVALGSRRRGKDESYEALIESASETPVSKRTPQSMPVVLGYTSGTTGRPKGAILTGSSIASAARITALSYRLPLRATVAYTPSMSFVATVISFMVTTFYLGGTILLAGKWDTERLLHLVETQTVDWTYVPSPYIEHFTQMASDRPKAISDLKTLVHAGSKVDRSVLQELVAVVGDRFVEAWGMTENSGALVTCTTRDDFRGDCGARDVYASVGCPSVESLVEIVDDRGDSLPHDAETVGELVVQSPALMQGYWRNPTATRNVLRAGWYHTGDLGSIDEAGYVYISDRRSDLIVSGGINVYPSEVEAVITSHPAVSQCAVVGVPHERWGQTVVAVVVPLKDSSPSEEDVVFHCRSRLASYKKPTRVYFVRGLPRTTSNKVKRNIVRDWVADETRIRMTQGFLEPPPNQR